MSTATQNEWLVPGKIPKGVTMALVDLNDPSPEELLAQGWQMVVLVHDNGRLPVLVTTHADPSVFPDGKVPAPYWLDADGCEVAA